jgi:thioredoxin-like negative regulator of GroEL
MMCLAAELCYTCGMSTTTALKQRLGKVAAALDENISDEEMDTLLAGRREEIEALLEEAWEDERRGDEAPLEPLHKFLLRARKYSARSQ